MSTPFNPQNPYTQNQTQSQPEKKKASMGKKILLGGVGVIVVLGMAGACSPTDNDTTPTTTETQVSTQVESPASESSVAPEQTTERVEEQKTTEQQVEEEAEVSREFKNALRSAESYLRFSHFSYQGLYKQLTSEYGEGYSAEAAQYAVDNVEVDWNQEAVEAAESYLEFMPMSEAELLNQLTSEYGENFTQEQAQHAVSTVY